MAILYRVCFLFCAMFFLPALLWAGNSSVSVLQDEGLAIALEGEKCVLKITLPKDLQKDLLTTSKIRIMDHLEREVLSQNVKSSAQRVIEIPLTIERRGYFRAFATVSDKDGKEVVSGETSFAIVPDVELNRLSPNSPFGIGAYYVVRFNPEQLEIAARLQKRLGAAWNRDELLWDLCEPEPDKWQWEKFDRAVEACRRNNILVMGLLDYWGKWTTPLTEKGYRDYAHYACTMVARYRPGGEFAQSKRWKDKYGIRYWEIWNEPATFWTGSGEQFGSLLKHAYASIKSADPTAHVFFDNWGEQFDAAVIATAGRDSFDGIAPHFYCPPRSPEDGEIDQAMKKTVEFYRSRGISRPFWITEMGWPADNSLVRQNDQARFLVRSYILAFAAGIDKVFWYNFVNDGMNKEVLEYGVLNREDFTPKVAYPAYVAMVERLSNREFSRQVKTPEPLRIYIFHGDSAALAVVWSLNANGSLYVSLPADKVRLYDMMGNSLKMEQVDRATFAVPLSPEPVYMEAEIDKETFATSLDESEVRGIALLNMDILPLVGSLDKGTSVCVEIENYSRKAVRGTLNITPPAGWSAKTSERTFPPIQPGEKTTVCVEFTECMRQTGNIYHIEVVAKTDDGNEMKISEDLYELVATRGNPIVDGNLGEWESARWVSLNRERQAVGLQPYADWNISARIATQWNEKGFFFAGVVQDNRFYQPHSGDLVWMGDNFQLAFDTTLNRNSTHEHPGEYLYGLSLTDKGEEMFRWRGGSQPPSLVDDGVLKVKRVDEHTTSYECFIPEKHLSPLEFKAGVRFGFSFILNDNDGGGRRGWLEWTPGIGTGFNSKYFTIWTLAR